MGVKSLSVLIQSSNEKPGVTCCVHFPPCPPEIDLANPLAEREQYNTLV